ncbi:MAG: MSMEG_0567/Sll0786 family nitrogen starvation N-acetyltransferase [Ilumatobacter sp.]|uniref:MSMEG_0567/Sll0786 family nitrogen starvation N-acetyltransferase n=1 Tax=Ilumatobacter sp. TaxID=1967498 RepID=UPI00391BE119
MSTAVACWDVDTATTSSHLAIRHRVFVEEQGVMVLTDIDAWDRDITTINVLAAHGREVAGTVRLYDLGEGRWKGDRLAVLPAHRASMVGACLVRYAVATAAAAGGTSMDASVQVANVSFFERLGWRCDGEVGPYFGLPHQPMVIDLEGVAPIASAPVSDAVLRLDSVGTSRSSLLVTA